MVEPIDALAPTHTRKEIEAPWTKKNGKCGVCGKEEHGYAKKHNGKWVAVCWKCVQATVKKGK